MIDDNAKTAIRKIVQATAELSCLTSTAEPTLESKNVQYAIERLLASLDAYRKAAGRS